MGNVEYSYRLSRNEQQEVKRTLRRFAEVPDMEARLDYSAVTGQELAKVLPKEVVESINAVAEGKKICTHISGFRLGYIRRSGDYGKDEEKLDSAKKLAASLSGILGLKAEVFFGILTGHKSECRAEQRDIIEGLPENYFQDDSRFIYNKNEIHQDRRPFNIIVGLHTNEVASTDVYSLEDIFGKLSPADVENLMQSNFYAGYGSHKGFPILVKGEDEKLTFDEKAGSIFNVTAKEEKPIKSLDTLREIIKTAEPAFGAVLKRGDVLILGKGQMHDRSEHLPRSFGPQRAIAFNLFYDKKAQNITEEKLAAARRKYIKPQEPEISL